MAGKTIVEVISMVLLWKGIGIGISGIVFLITHMAPDGVRVTLIFLHN